MDCIQVQELISEYVDNMLEEQDRKKIDLHLQECPQCRSDFEQLKDIVLMFNNIEAVKPPQDFKKSVMKKIRQEVGIKKVIFGKRYWLPLVATAAVLIIMIGTFSLSDMTGDLLLNMGSSNKEMVSEEKVNILEDGQDTNTEIELRMFSAQPELDTAGQYPQEAQGTQESQALPDTREAQDTFAAQDVRDPQETSDAGNVEIATRSIDILDTFNSIEKVQIVLTVDDLTQTKNKVLDFLGLNSQVFETEAGLIIMGWEEKDQETIDYKDELNDIAEIQFEAVSANEYEDELKRLNDRKLDLENLNREVELKMVNWQLQILKDADTKESIIFYEISLVQGK